MFSCHNFYYYDNQNRQPIDLNGVSGHISGNTFLSANHQLFRIISSTRADAGEYLCEARNNLGAVRKSFTIEVLGNFFDLK